MKLRKAISGGILIVLLLIIVPWAFGNGLNGGQGLTYVKSAWNLKPGYLTLYGRSQVWGQVSSRTVGSIAVWDIQGAVSFNYGITDHLELAVSPVIYQDTQRGEKKYMVPGDLFLGLKFGSYNIKGSSLTWGVSLDTRFPMGEEHNIVFEPYSYGSVEWGFTSMLSYSKDPLYPEDNLNVDFNLRYVNHNDVKKLSENSSLNVNSMTQEFLYGFGMKIPTSEFDFTVEMYGNAFIQKPPKEAVYSVENYLYLTPGINYQALRWLTLKVAADIRISSNSDQTTYQYLGTMQNDLPNYPSWRINFGLNILLLPVSAYKVSDKDILMRKAENRRELFEQIIKEQRETESAEEELDRIKNERRKAERELERLRRILEGEQKKKKTDEPPSL